jgi:hypothetical protein
VYCKECKGTVWHSSVSLVSLSIAVLALLGSEAPRAAVTGSEQLSKLSFKSAYDPHYQSASVELSVGAAVHAAETMLAIWTIHCIYLCPFPIVSVWYLAPANQLTNQPLL